MQEQGHDLSVDVRLEQEAGDVSEGDDGGRVEQEEHPDALVVLVEEHSHEDDEQDGDVGHDDVEDDVGSPVAREGHP